MAKSGTASDVRCGTEAFVRELLCASNAPTVIFVETGGRHVAAHESVARTYGLPIWHTTSLLPGSKHPSDRWHAKLARELLELIRGIKHPDAHRKTRENEAGGLTLPQKCQSQLPPPICSHKDLAIFSACSKPLWRQAAGGTAGAAAPLVPMNGGDPRWATFEDRPGKPGLIVNATYFVPVSIMHAAEIAPPGLALLCASAKKFTNDSVNHVGYSHLAVIDFKYSSLPSPLGLVLHLIPSVSGWTATSPYVLGAAWSTRGNFFSISPLL